MGNRTTTWGGLKTQVVEPDSPEQILGNVVLCHGYGAPGTDLVPLVPLFFKFAPQLQRRVRFIFPAAPLSLEEMGMPEGRAWWQIDLWKLQEKVAAGRHRDLINESPAGVPAAREKLTSLLQECSAATGIPMERTVIGGFSQGAMLTTDVALHLSEAPAGLMILSGMLINQADWSARMRQRSGLAVFQSHGKYDQLLPYELATILRDELQAAGSQVDFCEFPGGHEIPFDVMKLAAAFLQRCLAPAI